MQVPVGKTGSNQEKRQQGGDETAVMRSNVMVVSRMQLLVNLTLLGDFYLLAILGNSVYPEFRKVKCAISVANQHFPSPQVGHSMRLLAAMF